MPVLKSIRHRANNDLFSISVFKGIPEFSQYDPDLNFTKWAAVEVTNQGDQPDTVQPFLLTGGLYAVHLYRGGPAGAFAFFKTLFTEWLPASGYVLDDRPHFEVMGRKYKHNDPASEEEVWIPVRPK